MRAAAKLPSFSVNYSSLFFLKKRSAHADKAKPINAIIKVKEISLPVWGISTSVSAFSSSEFSASILLPESDSGGFSSSDGKSGISISGISASGIMGITGTIGMMGTIGIIGGM